MCQPEHYGVLYAINPWMDPQAWARDDDGPTTAAGEWAALHGVLTEHGAEIELVPPARGLPDLVFTANGAVVLDRTALLARFRHAERQGEEREFDLAFQALHARGLVDRVVSLPRHIMLEGAGDCVWDDVRSLFWMGHGPRSDVAASDVIADVFAAEIVALELADPRFYHLDTALSPLPRGEVMYFPGAFTAKGRDAICEQVAPEMRIAITEADACRLAANAVCLGDALVMAGCSDPLRADLAERGYRVAATPLDAFRRSGGSAFCLTLRLDRTAKPACDEAPTPAIPLRREAAG
jgi:N-dimethylarginine dimethylaminohydrolase